jgi:hypothetical protein
MKDRAQEIHAHVDMLAAQIRAAEDDRAESSKGLNLFDSLLILLF